MKKSAGKVTPAAGEPTRTGDSVSASLRASRTDMLDLVQINCGASDRERESSTTDVLPELKRAGVIRFLGASVYSVNAATSAMDSGVFDCLQIAYSALDRIMECDLLSGCCETNCTYSKARYERCGRLPELAYRFVFSNPAIHTVLAGVTSIQELDDAICWSGRSPLSPELLEEIRRMPMLSEQLLTPAFWPSFS